VTATLLTNVREAVSLKLHHLVDKANLVFLRQVVDAVYFRRLVSVSCGCLVYHHERLPETGPAILVANHSSHMDAGVIQTLFPLKMLPKIRPSGARDHFTKSLLWHLFARGFMRLLFVDRGSGRLAKVSQIDPFAELHAPIKEGVMIIIFPEGTRSGDTSFKPGIVHLARKYPEVPIIPILLCGTREVLPPHTVGFKAGPIKVYVGKQYTFDHNKPAGESVKELERYIYSLDQDVRR